MPDDLISPINLVPVLEAIGDSANRVKDELSRQARIAQETRGLDDALHTIELLESNPGLGWPSSHTRVWSDDPFDERNGYQDVVSAGEYIDLKSSFIMKDESVPEVIFFRSLAIAIRNWFTSILIVSAIVGCGCRGPERTLPAPNDSHYKKIETMIERSLYPNIEVLAPDKKRQLTQVRELHVLATLGYFYRTSRGFYMPTERARKLSKHDDWPPMIGGPFDYRFNDTDHISLRIGSYSVVKLTSAAHYEGAPCGGFGDEADAYGFIGKLSLNALGRALLEKHLLYTRLNASSPIRQWDGHRPVHDIWSDNPDDVDTGYRDTTSHGEYVTLKSALL